MDRKETIDKLTHANTEAIEKLFPNINAVFNTEIGKELIVEDLNRFNKLYNKILGGEYEEIKVEDFVELKYLQKRILILSKRIKEYLKLAEK